MRKALLAFVCAAALVGGKCAEVVKDVDGDPMPVDFGDVYLRDTGHSALTLTNKRAGAAALSAGTVTGNGFSTDGTAPAIPQNIAPAGTLRWPLQFQPPAAGPHTGSLNVTVGGDAGTVELKGRGVLAWFGLGVGVVGPGSAASGLDFGPSRVNVPKEEEFRLQNGDQAFAITLSALPQVTGNGFALVKPRAGDLPITIPSLRARQFRLSFTPPNVGRFEGELVVTNAAGTVIMKLILRGEGTE